MHFKQAFSGTLQMSKLPKNYLPQKVSNWMAGVELVRFSNWLESQLEERSPPEGYFFLQRLLEPSICIATPYLHTFLNSAGCQLKLLQCQTLSKSIQLRARADLAPPPVWKFATPSLAVHKIAFFRLDFSPFSFLYFPGTVHELPCVACSTCFLNIALVAGF